MNFWAIVKMIAEIIANLPFSEDTSITSEMTVNEVVTKLKAEIEKSDMSAQVWEELLPHIIAIIRILLAQRGL
jgi:hypothetical protein